MHEDEEDTFRDKNLTNGGNGVRAGPDAGNSIVPAEKKRVVKKAGVKKVRGGGDDINDFINENVSKLNKAMTKADEDLILNSLRNHYVFYALTDDELEFVVQKMFYCENTDEFVFKQDDKASSYFIIEKGSVEIVINNEVTTLLTNYLPLPSIHPPFQPTLLSNIISNQHFRYLTILDFPSKPMSSQSDSFLSLIPINHAAATRSILVIFILLDNLNELTLHLLTNNNIEYPFCTCS